MMAHQKITALVADDDDSIRILLQRILENAQYNVLIASDGKEAMDMVSNQYFDVALLDISMPGMTGMEVLEWLSLNRPEVCPIMITAITDVQTAVEAMKLGAYDYITKPFMPEDAVRKIRESLVRKHADLEEDKHRTELEKKVVEQTEQLQQQFSDLMETLAREHTLLYKMSEKKPGGVKNLLRRLPPELQEPLSSVDDFRDALLKILSRQSK